MIAFHVPLTSDFSSMTLFLGWNWFSRGFSQWFSISIRLSLCAYTSEKVSLHALALPPELHCCCYSVPASLLVKCRRILYCLYTVSVPLSLTRRFLWYSEPFLRGGRLLMSWSLYSSLTLPQMKGLFLFPPPSHIDSKTVCWSSRVVFLTTLGSWSTEKKGLYRVSAFYSGSLSPLSVLQNRVSPVSLSVSNLCMGPGEDSWGRVFELM